MGFLKQLKETSVSVLPIALIAAVAGLCLNVFSTDGVSFVEFVFSVVLVILGLTIFLLGVDVGLIPVGNQIGSKVTQKRNVLLLLLTGFFLGAIITVAEPDVQVLAKQVNEINSEISVFLLTFMICIGVGLFVAISFLNLYVIFCVTVVIVKPCIKENKALKAYNPNSVSSIVPIFPKSIPDPPDNLFITPLKISVVALPKIFGPTIENIVLPTANKITTIIGILYFDK